MFRKDRQQPKEKKWLFGAILSYYIVKKIFSIHKRRRMKELEGNFKDFLHAEAKEIKEYTRGKENISEFALDSGNIFKDYFIPHSGNNHTPKIIRTKSLAIIVLITMILKFSLVAYLYFVFPNPGKADDSMVAKILELVNVERKANNLKPLEMNTVLSNSALNKANDMASNDYFAHTTPDGRKPWEFIDRSKYAYSIVGENLAMNFSSAESAHRALINSPSHKHNILNQKYEDIGLAVVNGVIGGKQTNILVQLFSVKVSMESTDKMIAVNKAQEVKTAAVKTKSVSVSTSSQIAFPVVVERKKTQVSTVVEKDDTKAITQSPKSLVTTTKPEKAKTDDSTSSSSSVVRISSSSEEKIDEDASSTESMLVIEHPGDEVLREYVDQKISLEQAEKANIEKTLPELSIRTEYNDDKNFIFSKKFIYFVQVAIASFLSLLIISLLLNIFIRYEIQHKPVLIRTMLVVVFVATLLFVNFHYLEGGTTTILMS